MRVFEWISSIVKRRPWTVIIVSFLITVVMGLGITVLKGEITYQSILPKDFPSNKVLHDLDRNFGGISYEYVLLAGPRMTDNRIVAFLVGLEDYINNSPDFNRGQVQTRPGQQGADVPKILKAPIPMIQDYLSPFIANVKKGIAQTGLYVPLSGITNEIVIAQTGKDFQQNAEQDYLSQPQVRKSMVGKQKFLTSDYRAALVVFKVGANLTDRQQIQFANNLEKLFQEKLGGIEGLKMYFSGDPTISRDFDNHIRDKTVLLFLVGLGLVIFVLFITFRRFSDSVFPLAVVVLSLVWTLGFMGWFKIPYSIASVALLPLLLGHALTFVVPYTARYYEEMENEFRSVQMVGKALVGVGVGLFLAAITSVFGFLVFELSDLPPLKNFGLAAAVGTIFAFLLTVVLLPAVMVVRDRSYETGPEEERQKRKMHFDGLSRRRQRGLFARSTERVLGWFTTISTRHSAPLIAVSTILVLGGLVLGRGLTTDSDLRKLAPKGLPSVHADFEMEKHFGGQQTDFIMVKGDVTSPQALKAMLNLESAITRSPLNNYHDARMFPANAIVGLPDTLAAANNGALPANAAGVDAAIKTIEDNGGFVYNALLTPDKKAALIVLNGSGATTTDIVNRKLKLLNSASKQSLETAGLTYELGGITPLTKDLTRNIIPTETWSSFLSLVLCAILLIAIFKSISYGLITLTVAFAGVSAQLAFLVLKGYPLDVITSLSSALVIGVGSNFGILFTHRYIQQVRSGQPADEAISVTMHNLGRANVVAGLATVAAFLVVMLSGMVPLVRFGGVTAFGIGVSLVASLTMMPALLFRLSRHSRTVEQHGILQQEPEAGPAV